MEVVKEDEGKKAWGRKGCPLKREERPSHCSLVGHTRQRPGRNTNQRSKMWRFNYDYFKHFKAKPLLKGVTMQSEKAERLILEGFVRLLVSDGR